MSTQQRVLIVDDEPRNQRIITETLYDGCMDLKCVSSGEEALSVMEEFRPDLVLLDIMMPGIDGYEVCKKIRANPKLSLTKVVLVSGKAMIEERLKGYEVGADDYMTKPFVPEELLAKAKVFSRLSKVERELLELNTSLDEQVKKRTQQLFDTEAKLVNSAKYSALGEMASGIAHEINTPLGTINLVADQISEMILEDPIDRKAIAQMSQTISNTVKRCGKIIQGLRTFSRDGNMDKLEQASIKQIIDNTLILCGEKLKHGGVELRVDMPAEEIVLSCRPVQVSQVLLNLVSNSCDAIAKLSDRWIQLSVRKATHEEKAGIDFSVTDSGPRISAEIESKIFEPFFSTKETGKGTGLGLSISKGIAEAHKGNLSLDSESPTTKFVLWLPLD